MNDSNNIFNNNVTATPQNSNPNVVNPILDANNSVNKLNTQPLNTANVGSVNSTPIHNQE